MDQQENSELSLSIQIASQVVSREFEAWQNAIRSASLSHHEISMQWSRYTGANAVLRELRRRKEASHS